MARFEITVAARCRTRITAMAIQKRIRSHSDANVNVESIGDGIILSGTVANQLEAQQAYDIAAHFIATLLRPSAATTAAAAAAAAARQQQQQQHQRQPVAAAAVRSSASGGGVNGALNGISSSKIVNAIVVLGRDQVMLKVTVAEMDRQVIKQLGINLSGSFGYGSAVVNFNTTNPFPINGTPSSSVSGGFKGLTATLQAMEQVGVVRTLAEPTLTAISGESAHFLAGGMFPYPIPAGARIAARRFNFRTTV